MVINWLPDRKVQYESKYKNQAEIPKFDKHIVHKDRLKPVKESARQLYQECLDPEVNKNYLLREKHIFSCCQPSKVRQWKNIRKLEKKWATIVKQAQGCLQKKKEGRIWELVPT